MLSVVFVQQWRSYRRIMHGLGWWSLGPPTAFAGALLMGLQASLPPVIGYVLGNGLCFASAVMFHVGAARFFGQPVPRWPWALLALAVLALAIFSLGVPDFRGRLIAFAGAQVVLQGAQLRLIQRHATGGFAGGFLLASTGFAFIMFLLRLVTVGLEPADGRLFQASLGHNLYLAGFGFWGMSQTMAIVLLVQEALRRRLEDLAQRDALTGLLGRRAIFAKGLAALVQSRGRPVAVLLIDLDHFKVVNDTYGHIIGDAVLEDFAARVNMVLRPGDLIGRYGGEEFLAVLPDTTAEVAAELAEGLRASRPAADLPPVTISIGLAATTGTTATTAAAFDHLVDQADLALYQAKRAGRDRVVQAAAQQARRALPGRRSPPSPPPEQDNRRPAAPRRQTRH